MKLATRSILALSFAVSLAAAPKPANFSGTWKLDRAASKNLPRGYDHVSNQTIVVVQSANRIEVATSIERDSGSSTQQILNFDLNGQPVESEAIMRTPNGDQKIPMTLTGTVRDDHKIELRGDRQIKTPQSARTLTTKELWELSSNRKTLTIHRTDEMQGGTLAFDLVFTGSR